VWEAHFSARTVARMNLIINADDLGFSLTVNQTIFELHKLERLTSTSLVVNMPASQSALEEIREHPGLNVGIHLNLTKGKPITPVAHIPSLVTGMGGLYTAPYFYPMAMTKQFSPEHVEIECRAQIELALKVGLQPSHLDSHNHWHMLPLFKQIVLEMAQEYKISCVRPTKLRGALLPSRLWLRTAVDRQFPHQHPDEIHYQIALDDWMTFLGRPRALFFSDTLRRILNNSNVTLELILHPGRANDPDFPPDSISPKRRQWDFDFITSVEFDSWLNSVDGRILSSRKNQ